MVYLGENLRPTGDIAGLSPEISQWARAEGWTGPLGVEEDNKRYDWLKILGVRGENFLDSERMKDIGLGLGMESSFVSTVENIEGKRSIAKGLLTISHMSKIAGLGILHSSTPEHAYWYFGTSLFTEGLAFIVASHNDRKVNNIIASLSGELSRLPLGDITRDKLSESLHQIVAAVPEQERSGLDRPIEAMMWRSIEAMVVAGGNREAWGLLGAGLGMLTFNDFFIKNVYARLQSKYLDKQRQLVVGEIGIDEANFEALKPALATMPINGIGTALQMMGYALSYKGGVEGMMSVVMSVLSDTVSRMVSKRNSMVNADEAQKDFWQQVELNVGEDLNNMILGHDSLARYIGNRKDSDLLPEKLSNNFWLMHGIDRALMFKLKLTNKTTGQPYIASALIDFSDPKSGAFHLIGENGFGKSHLARNLLKMRSDHEGWVAVQLPDEIAPRDILDLTKGDWDTLRHDYRFISSGQVLLHGGVANIRGIKFAEISGLGTKEESISLLQKYGFDRLVAKLDSSVSGLTDKSEGEQVILATIAHMERALRDGAKLVIVDEPYSNISQENKGKLARMFDDYVAQGLMVVVIAQDEPKFIGRYSVRGVRLEEEGFDYVDNRFWQNSAEDHGPYKGLYVDLFGNLSWKSLFGLGFEKTEKIDDLALYRQFRRRPEKFVDDLILLSSTFDKWHSIWGKMNIISGGVHTPSLLNGMAEYWEKKLQEEIGEHRGIRDPVVLREIFDDIRKMSVVMRGVRRFYPDMVAEDVGQSLTFSSNDIPFFRDTRFLWSNIRPECTDNEKVYPAPLYFLLEQAFWVEQFRNGRGMRVRDDGVLQNSWIE